MPRQTRRDARYLSKLPAAPWPDRLHGGDGVLTDLGPLGRLGRYTATQSEHIAAAGPELQVIQANPSYRFPVSGRSTRATSTAPTASRYSRSNGWLLLADISDPNLGGGARVAQATREQSPMISTTTEEVER